MNSIKILPASALALVLVLAATLFIQVAKADNVPSDDSLHICIPVDGTLTDVPLPTYEVQVLRSEPCLGITDREPDAAGHSFEMKDGRVYLFSEIQAPKGEPVQIKHIWKHEGKVMSTVELDILGPTFRTWSYKTISDSHKGTWTVDVVNAAGDLLDTQLFTIE